MWFGVVCALIDNDMRHNSGENVTTVTIHIVFDKNTDNT